MCIRDRSYSVIVPARPPKFPLIEPDNGDPPLVIFVSMSGSDIDLIELSLLDVYKRQILHWSAVDYYFFHLSYLLYIMLNIKLC